MLSKRSSVISAIFLTTALTTGCANKEIKVVPTIDEGTCLKVVRGKSGEALSDPDYDKVCGELKHEQAQRTRREVTVDTMMELELRKRIVLWGMVSKWAAAEAKNPDIDTGFSKKLLARIEAEDPAMRDLVLADLKKIGLTEQQLWNRVAADAVQQVLSRVSGSQEKGEQELAVVSVLKDLYDGAVYKKADGAFVKTLVDEGLAEKGWKRGSLFDLLPKVQVLPCYDAGGGRFVCP